MCDAATRKTRKITKMIAVIDMAHARLMESTDSRFGKVQGESGKLSEGVYCVFMYVRTPEVHGNGVGWAWLTFPLHPAFQCTTRSCWANRFSSTRRHSSRGFSPSSGGSCQRRFATPRPGYLCNHSYFSLSVLLESTDRPLLLPVPPLRLWRKSVSAQARLPACQV